ncbi:MAG: undecaprenyl-phosphate glucose phosphotransferase [Rhodocyclales bacterium]|nr:undecaprenyl-phosphate glucose phosphotransferase [Rhodocyclales bacterium]
MKYRGILSEYAELWEMLLRLADALAVLGSGWVASIIYLGGLPNSPGYTLGLVLAVLLCLVIFPSFGLYRAWRGISLGEEMRTLTLAWVTTFGALTFFAFVTKTGPDFSRGWFLIWLSLGWVVLLAGRIVLRLFQRSMRQRGFNLRRVAIVGSPSMAEHLTKRLADTPWAGLVVAASFSATDGEDTGFADLVARVRAGGIDQVWIALPLREEATIHHVQHALRHTTVDIRYVPDISSFTLLNHSVSEIAGLPVINLSSSGMDSLDRLTKVIEDRVLALLIILVCSPLMLLIAMGVKLSSPGPVLFRQRRSGLGGETITILKFRSMVIHAEPAGGVTQARRDDPRVTPFGALLRRTSLDELPQFFNVLAGDMSIVGPRPHAVEHNEQYKVLVSSYMARHKIKPGITGWAQVNGFRGETDTLEKMQKRVQHDLHYIENWSLWLDLKIIALTLIKGFSTPDGY